MGSKVRLCANCRLPSGSEVFVRLWPEGNSETLVPMQLEGEQAVAELTLPETPCLVWYFFLIRLPGGRTLRYGAPSGEGRLVDQGEPPAYQITVYDPAFSTPAPWRHGVCYQIFPDRFRRSSWEDFRARAQYHTNLGRTVRIHDRWNEALEWQPAPGQENYSPDDFFGGDLQGIIEKLDFLASLGVTYLYLNPIFESCSNHRYNTADYHRIDPILGSEEDFSRLVAEAKQRGISLILDGVFSHTGSDSRYFNREGRYSEPGAYQGQASPYYEWYSFTSFPDGYDSWWGFPSLPNVKELTPSYQDFIMGAHGVINHWTGYGLGGWRLDVADELPDDFIRLFRKRLKEQNPEAVLIGEVWEDCSNKFGPEGRRDYVDGDLLDAAMNYPFSQALVSYLTGKTDAYAFNEALGTLREHYPKPFFDASMNLITSHDDVRLLYKLAGAPERNALPREEQQAYCPDAEALALSIKRIPLAFAMQVAFPGVPTLYYGDEAGIPGMADPFNRTTYPWGEEDAEILSAAKRLFPLKGANRVLQEGLMRMGALNLEVFALVRNLPDTGETAVLFINRSELPQTVSLGPDTLTEGPDAGAPLSLAGRYFEVSSNDFADVSEALTVTLPPISYRLYIKGE